jgi:hypothetical protein
VMNWQPKRLMEIIYCSMKNSKKSPANSFSRKRNMPRKAAKEQRSKEMIVLSYFFLCLVAPLREKISAFERK